jgi:hypothetical protein
MKHLALGLARLLASSRWTACELSYRLIAIIAK